MRRRLFNMERLDADGDQSGGGITTEQFGELSKTIEGMAKTYKDQEGKSAKVAESVEKIEADLALETAKLGSQLTLLKTSLQNSYGKSGADDWLMEMAKFLTGAYQFNLVKGGGGKVDDELALSNGVKIGDLIDTAKVDKAAVDFTTTQAASGALLIPQILRPGIIDLKDIYGTIYPKMTKMTVPAGHNVDMTAELTRPVATWRETQVTAIDEEATPMAFAQRQINTMLAGTYIQIANELIASPAINFAAIATTRIIAAIMRLLETSVISGQDATAGPADGIINYTGVNDQGNIASATFASVVTFLQACVTDNEYASVESTHQLLVTPTDALSLAAQAVGASELTGMLVWGNPRQGIPTTLLGREVIQHPALTATNRHMILGDLSTILLGESPSFSIDVNPWLETAYKENASWLRVFNHYDWVLGQPSEFHFTTVAVT